MKRRIIAGMGANSFGMAITIAIQLLSLPLFLHYWDTATYGKWLILSAIPAYLSMADVGMVTAAGNKMTIAVGKGDIAEANRIFQSAQAFMLLICGFIGLLMLPLIIFAPLPWITSTDIRLTLAALIVGVLAALFGGLAEAVFKSTGRYATGTFLSNYARLGEWLGSMFGLMLVGTFTGVAVCGMVMRLTGVLCSILMASRGNHGLSWGIQSAKKTEIRSMIKPAVSFMAFPLANALSFQGITLMVGTMFGPVAVAMFNTYRTIARLAVQVTAIFSHALWPEFSRLFGQGGISALIGLYRRSTWLSAIQSICFSFLLYFLSPWLLRVWTHNAIEFVPSLMLLMLLYAAVGGMWHIPRVLLMATNQHVGLAYWILAAGGLCVGLSWIFGLTLQLKGVVTGMLLSELFIAVVCSWLAYVAINNKSTNNGSDMGVMLR